MQNTSTAVMARRKEPKDSADYFPTPPWAARALLEHVLMPRNANLRELSCLEPACGEGYMARTLSEYFDTVLAADAYGYSFAPVRDFLTEPYEAQSVDWVITNPPFRLAEEFTHEALRVARRGVALIGRTSFLEGMGRYERIFSKTPPSFVAQFVERVPLIKGRVDKAAGTATSYAWFVWDKTARDAARIVWIPPCRKALERSGDYARPSPQS